MKAKYLLLFSQCILVDGASRSVICDLQRGDVHIIPNSLFSLFVDKRYIDLSEVAEGLNEQEQAILEEYIKFLLQSELAFYCSIEELKHFPKLSQEWLFQAHISHCILDSPNDQEYFGTEFLSQLAELCCNYIQFRFYEAVKPEYLKHLLDLINNSQVKSVEILLPVNGTPEFEGYLIGLVKSNKKISCVTLHGAHESKVVKEGEFGMGAIYSTTNQITGSSHCGIISSDYFSISIPTYTESINYNSCLNKKISVDTDGNIKNCPSMVENFGHISNTSLIEAIEKPGFKKHWKINKDQIQVCKDCEFRHICTDCRAYLEDPDDSFSKPLKCGYDPYSCDWEEWSKNPFKEKTKIYYNLTD